MMGLWKLLLWGVLVGIAALAFIKIAAMLVCRAYWREREAHTARMGDMIQQAVKQARAKDSAS